MSQCPTDASHVDKVGRAFKGSMLQIQTYVNRLPHQLNAAISPASPGVGDWDEIELVSPLETDSFREYRDRDFTNALRFDDDVARRLHGFWPSNGPCWDALAIGRDRDTTGCLILEAKKPPRGACRIEKGNESAFH